MRRVSNRGSRDLEAIPLILLAKLEVSSHSSDVPLLIWRNKSRTGTGSAGPGSSAHSVNVSFVVFWWVVVDYMDDAIEVEASRRHIRSN